MFSDFQALSRDLLQVSVQLESVEEQLQKQSSVRKTRGVTVRELEKERDMLKMRRDTLEAQLRDNRVLSVEVRHFMFGFFSILLTLFFICLIYACRIGGAFPPPAGGSC